MKARIGFNLLVLVVAVTCLAATGCKKKPVNTTPLPGGVRGSGVNDVTPSNPFNTGDGAIGTQMPEGTGIAQSPSGQYDNYIQDANMFKSETVYFAYDRSAVRPSEISKIETVASYLKSNPSAAVRVEGNCDERGTEEYNRSLGERRALSIREHLVQSGVAADHVITVTYGEDRPAVQGHEESAWSKNRRGDFVILTPPH